MSSCRRQRSLGRKVPQSDQVLLEVGFVVMLGDTPVTEQRLKLEKASAGDIHRLHDSQLARRVKCDRQFTLQPENRLI